MVGSEEAAAQSEEESRCVETVCCVCGIEFQMARSLYNQRKQDYEGFWCPNGHSQQFRKPEERVAAEQQIAELRRQVAELTRKLRQAEEERSSHAISSYGKGAEVLALRAELARRCWLCYLTSRIRGRFRKKG